MSTRWRGYSNYRGRPVSDGDQVSPTRGRTYDMTDREGSSVGGCSSRRVYAPSVWRNSVQRTMWLSIRFLQCSHVIFVSDVRCSQTQPWDGRLSSYIRFSCLCSSFPTAPVFFSLVKGLLSQQRPVGLNALLPSCEVLSINQVPVLTVSLSPNLGKQLYTRLNSSTRDSSPSSDCLRPEYDSEREGVSLVRCVE